MSGEDLIEIERAGRSCAVCHSRRGWRRFEVVRPADSEPVVLCGNCRTRFGDNPLAARTPASVSSPAAKPVHAAPAPKTASAASVPATARAAAESQTQGSHKPQSPRKPASSRKPPSPAKPVSPPNAAADESRRAEPSPDRLKAALSGMTGTFSTAMAARAAGLNNDKTLARLQDLERRGEIQRVGSRWSAEAPPSDIAAAMDRLEARTSNLRIVRERAPVG